MCTSTVEPDEALPEQPAMAMDEFTVVLSGMVTSVPLVSVQPDGAVAVTVYGAVWVATVAAVVAVTAYVPGAVDPVVLIVSVDEPPDVTEAGLNDALAPLGRPLADRVTVCAAPTVVVVLTVAVTELPGLIEPEIGDTATEKSCVG